jgi:intracellular sulfur oxidation DsrE/DsrF family protein
MPKKKGRCFMIRILRAVCVSAALAAAAFVPVPAAEPTAAPQVEFPQIAKYGGVFRLPAAEERPRAGGKVVFDTTAAAPAGKPNRGLESAARLVNIYASEDLGQARPRIAVILHFNATAAALGDTAHAKTPSGGPNPNRELVEQLLANGVEVWVCGQSVLRGGSALEDVLPGIRIAHSAMIFNMNRQADGWATLGVH